MPENTALRSRFVTGLAVSGVAMIAAIGALIHVLGVSVPQGDEIIVACVIFAFVSFPQFQWLVEWYRGFK